MLVFTSCKKDPGGGSGAANYSGNYKGNITVKVNGTVTQTLSDHTISVDQDAGGITTLTNNVVSANTGIVEGNKFTLTKKIIASSPTYNTEEYGTIVFAGTTATIDMHQDQVDLNNGAVLNTKVWTGVLNKQ